MKKPRILVTAAAGHTGTSQLRHYVEDYRRNAFAVNAPTDAVASVGGRAPEEFESIARRYATSRPEARRTVLRAAKALWNFTRILLTPPLDLDRIDRVQGHPGLETSELAGDSRIWRATHATTQLAVRAAP
ncbi:MULTISPECIES: hypothetical protein [unclassified Anaeromyxobacter]|uniref:hypothetical protein n=1 Tax=unclassified Anaeromyxobacter TaxID=2620896 RepID=UPI001F586170|nr:MULTISPECIES: hypothetical protein [unclassified Anaeromyxobacter]